MMRDVFRSFLVALIFILPIGCGTQTPASKNTSDNIDVDALRSGNQTNKPAAAASPTIKQVVLGVVTTTGPDTITVNGLTFNTANVIITENGQVVTNPPVGSTVTLLEVAFQPGPVEFEGTVEEIDVEAGTLVVDGTLVTTDAETEFDGVLGLDEIEVGATVAIEGVADDEGVVAASEIEYIAPPADPAPSDPPPADPAPPAPGDVLDLSGEISGLDADAMTFLLGDTTVNYATATIEPAGTELADGMIVNVTGTLDVELVLVAEAIIVDALPAPAGTPVVLLGSIDSVTSPSNIVVDGRTVKIRLTTALAGAAPVPNAQVLVVGTLDATGAIAATEITSMLIEAPIDDIDAEAGTLTVLGLNVAVTEDTALGDLTLADINVGDTVRVVLGMDGDSLVAAEISVVEDSGTVTLQGPAELGSDNTLSILGVDVAANETTSFLIGGAEATAADFFGALEQGTLVAATGAFADDVLSADTLELID